MKHEQLIKNVTELTKNETRRINNNVFPRQSSLKTASQTVEKYQMPRGVSGSITSTVCPDLWGMSWMGCSVICSLLSAAVFQEDLATPAALHDENTL